MELLYVPLSAARILYERLVILGIVHALISIGKLILCLKPRYYLLCSPTAGSRSPSSLIDRTAALSLTQPGDDLESESESGSDANLGPDADAGLRERAATQASKQRARQQRKYHSKRGAQRAGGRHKGSKAKADTRVKLDRGGIWD